MTMTNEELLNVFKTNANKRPFQLADGTIEMYLKNINYFLESIDNKNILEITRKDVKQYMLALQTSDSTYNQRLASIRTLYKVLAYILDDENIIVIADDSGISVDILDGAPGIYSARYAGVGASSLDNLNKLIQKLKEKGIEKTPAFYTAAIAIVCAKGEFCVHGWMHGEAIVQARGTNGFGYDPMFIPSGYTQTLGELDESVKKTISHRSKALDLAHIVLKSLRLI